MVPQNFTCCFVRVYMVWWNGHLNYSCPLCFLCRSVLLFKIAITKNRCYCCFQLGWLSDHLIGERAELLFGLLCVSFVNGYQFVCMLLSVLVLSVDLTVLVPDHCLSFYFLAKFVFFLIVYQNCDVITL